MSSEYAPGSMPNDGRWGWYRDHTGAEFQRVSTLVKKVETNQNALINWMKRQVLVGASRRDDLIAGAKAMKPHPVTGWSDAQKKDLNKLVERAEEAAKDTDGALTGTAMHTLTERLDRGEPLGDVVAGQPHQAECDVRAYEALIRLNGWSVVEIERTVINDELAVGGTFDRVYSIPGLTALLGPWRCQHGHDHGAEESQVTGDVKTENDPTKNGLHIGPQLAIYSRARRMWVPSEQAGADATLPAQYVAAPCVRQDVGIVVHVRDGHAVPYFVNLVDGWVAAQAARVQYEREKAAKNWLVAMPNIAEPAPAQVLTDTAVNRRANPPLELPALAAVAEHVAAGGSTTEGVGAALVKAYDTETAGEQVAVLDRQTGQVAWHSAPGTQVTVGGVGFVKIADTSGTQHELPIQHALDEIDRQAIANVWTAAALSDLGETWRIYTEVCGREWGGRVAEAADARRRQIECVQRSLHSGAGAVKCACGWTPGVAP